MSKTLSLSRGEMVAKGRVGTSAFVRGRSVRTGLNSYYAGTWAELELLVEEHFHNHIPGVGSVDGDTILVRVPPAGFFTSIIELTEDLADRVEIITTRRAEGEASYEVETVRGMKPPAHSVDIVLYRADLLAQDDDRSTDCEWEIISINADPAYPVPMTPTTMARNENHETGGTRRTYTKEQWAEAESFWATHAKVWED